MYRSNRLLGVFTLIGAFAWSGLADLNAATGAGLAELELRFESANKELGAQKAYESFQEEFTAFAREHAGTEEGLGAELWLLRMHWWKREAGLMQKEAGPFARRLVAEYGKSAALKRVPEFSYLFSAKDFEDICESLRLATPHAEVKAECLYSLGKKLERSNPERAREMFTELTREYGSLQYRYITYGEIAAAHLARHDKSSLKVGERAPEVIGTDVNGEPMKLSDYRGKVVVLDFWGDW